MSESKEDIEFILPLKDGGIVNIHGDRDYYSGCETCDYGSLYINYYCIELSKLTIEFEANQEYDYAISEGDMMTIILSNISDIIGMTELNFANWLEKKIIKYKENKEIFKTYAITKIKDDN